MPTGIARRVVWVARRIIVPASGRGAHATRFWGDEYNPPPRPARKTATDVAENPPPRRGTDLQAGRRCCQNHYLDWRRKLPRGRNHPPGADPRRRRGPVPVQTGRRQRSERVSTLRLRLRFQHACFAGLSARFAPCQHAPSGRFQYGAQRRLRPRFQLFLALHSSV